MAKTRWRFAENYHTQEFYLEDGMLIYKDYWDPGKNPNITKISFEDFLKGKFNFEVVMATNGTTVKEIKTSILELQNQK